MIQRYALVDSAQRVGFHARLDRLGVRYESLFDSYPEQKHKDIAPLLFHWADDDAVSREVVGLARTRPAVCVIGTKLSLRELADRFRAFHLVKIPHGRRLILRWYDTRILPCWLDTLDLEQRATFLYGIESWHFFNRFGIQVDLNIPSKRPEFPALPPIELTEEQYQFLLDGAQVDMHIQRLRKIIPDEIRNVPYPVLYPFLDGHLIQAHKQGIIGLDDCTQYLLLALYTSGNFQNSPVVKDLLSGWRSGLESFSDFISSLPEEIWYSGVPLWSARHVD